MRDFATTALDVIALLAIALGLGLAAAALWAPLGFIVGGLVLLIGSAVSTALSSTPGGKA